MYLCYIDESGTPEVPGNTSHFVLAGVVLPIWHWRDADREVRAALAKHGLHGEELHTAWLLRKYLEQSRIKNFDQLDWPARRAAVTQVRTAHLLNLQKRQKNTAYRQQRKNYKETSAYMHLTLDERRAFVREVADIVGNWGFARLFAECINKVHFDPGKTGRTVAEQAFEQVVSRFEQFLQKTDAVKGQTSYGLLVHDNNETVAKKHTDLMRAFHTAGTLWTNVERIIETPMFVDSRLTSMVQIADLCGYALRRYVENKETDLFRRVFLRADRFRNVVVGVRHYTDMNCVCDICLAHR